ncbi:hypothetical protein A9Q86_00700 [Flavobacteriales bacterium 33_180_T64]|nr:hypothetical protein A9Q86_00700 [Flavobacteriales bacterium 33_180_T64]
MKTILKISLIGTLLFSLVMSAQNTTSKVKVHKVWVTLLDGSKIKGNLYSANEIGIKVINNTLDLENPIIINADDIDELKIRRKGKIGNSILIGCGVGVAFGGLLGLISGDDEGGLVSFSKEEKVAMGAVVFGVLGTGVGALAGTKKEKFIITGNLEVYRLKLREILQYVLVQATN